MDDIDVRLNMGNLAFRFAPAHLNGSPMFIDRNRFVGKKRVFVRDVNQKRKATMSIKTRYLTKVACKTNPKYL